MLPIKGVQLLPTIRECLAKILADEEEQTILELLKEKTMAFTELKTNLERSLSKTVYNQSFTRSLHELDKYGLIYKKFTRTSSRYYSHYELSPLGKEILTFVRKIETTLPKT